MALTVPVTGNTIQATDIAQLVNLLNGTDTTTGILSGGFLAFLKDFRRSIQTPAFAASYTPDPTLGEVVRMTLTGAITVNNVVSSVAGQHLMFVWTQDGTGGRVVTYGGNYKTGGLTAFATTLSTVTIDEFLCVDGTIWRAIQRVTGQA